MSMRKPMLAAMVLVLGLGACGTVRDSRLNPLNWFGNSRSEAAVAGPVGDGRLLVAQVAQFSVEPATGGAILRATGLPPTIGWWDGELVLDDDASTPDMLAYRFVIRAPSTPRPVVTQTAREVTVARFVSNFRLEGVRRITVTGEGNARTVSRR
jgi:hypothetical protein